MYVHIGSDMIIDTNDIVAIMDLDNSTITKRGRDFISLSQEKHKIINVDINLLPKCYIIVENDDESIVYISPITSSTILKRINEGIIIE